MAKSNRLSVEQVDDSSDSNEDSNSNSAGVNCPHVNKAVQLTGIKKVLKGDSAFNVCIDCSKSNTTEEHEEIVVLLCLKCGHPGCCNGSKHAELHSKNRQSDVHDLAVDPIKWIVWCFKCNCEVPSASSKKLLECLEFVKKNYSKSEKSHSKMNGNIDYDVSQATSSCINITKPLQEQTLVETLPRIRGLANLGNTCFFNAVLQCLSQTPFLLSVLKETEEPGEKFSLPGGEVVFGDEKEILEPLDGELKEWGPLTKTLADTLSELQSGKPEVYYPRPLVHLLHSKCPQFAGYDQHDSHELLRQLLETVRTEDLQRYQQSILGKLSLDKKCERGKITEEQRKKVRAYGRQANDLLLRPEHVFRGFLVSILECQECYHVSEHVESFLDLSLPMTTDKPTPHVRRRSTSVSEDAAGTEKPSKHQLKKERERRTRTNVSRRRGSRQTGVYSPGNDASGAAAATGSGGEDVSGGEESDADVEDNVEPESVQSHDVIESGYSSEKAVNGDSACGSPSSDSNLPLNRDSAVASPTAATKTAESTSLDVTVSGEAISSPCQLSPVVSSDNSAPRDEDTNNNNNTKYYDLFKIELNKLEIKKDNEEDREEQKYSNWNSSASTGASSSKTVSNECTVQSCLNQFTAKELMTGNNKVGCEACTKRLKQGKDGKTVLTNASKQLLICTPPAILILHLKRFQVVRFTFKKKYHDVKFPTVLNLSPYCALKTPDGRRSNREPMYALYGVVEHGGTLYGGHYVAYVKVRKPLSPDDRRWSFLPRSSTTNLSAQSEECDDEPEGAAGGSPAPPPGKWYYVSDSRVNEVKEENVLQSQAYLLFYERIW